MRFADRQDAGRQLATVVERFQGPDLLVLALPRGGVVVALEIARALRAPLDVVVVRKLGAPGMRELALGAIAEGGITWIDRGLVRQVGATADDLERVTAEERNELRRRILTYRDGRELPDLRGRTVLLVDDGIATGATAQAAISAVRELHPRRLLLATPVISARAVPALARRVDALFSCHAPSDFQAVGRWYQDFAAVEDAEVIACLEAAAPPLPPFAAARNDDTVVEADGRLLPAALVVPPGAFGVIVFAHGGGGIRHHPRHQRVARALEAGGLATVLLDLLSEEEAERDGLDRVLRADVMFLASRLVQVTRQVVAHEALHGLPVGYLGASTGAAAALTAATLLPDAIRAVVLRGGRPDLVPTARLAHVRAPTLFVVGSEDRELLALHQRAAGRLGAPSDVRVVPGAGHVFEDPSALEVLSQLAIGWFRRHLAPQAVTTTPH